MKNSRPAPRRRERAPRLTLRLDEDRREVIQAIAAIEARPEHEVVDEAISLLALVYTASAGEGHARDRKLLLAAALRQVQLPAVRS